METKATYTAMSNPPAKKRNKEKHQFEPGRWGLVCKYHGLACTKLSKKRKNSITVRTWSDSDLQKIKSGKDKWLATVFMNGKTFSEKEIKYYPYNFRHRYAVFFEGAFDPIYVYATDKKMLKKFLDAEYRPGYKAHIYEEGSKKIKLNPSSGLMYCPKCHIPTVPVRTTKGLRWKCPKCGAWPMPGKKNPQGEIIEYDYPNKLHLTNLHHLPKGVGAPYLECIRSHDGKSLIAKQWRYKIPDNFEVLISFKNYDLKNKNPGAAWHTDRADFLNREARRFEHQGKRVAADFYSTMGLAERMSAAESRKMGMNPCRKKHRHNPSCNPKKLFYAWCLVCLGGGKQLHPPTTRTVANLYAGSHNKQFGHDTTIIPVTRKNPGVPRKICSNCGQWKYLYKGEWECLNGCTRKGLEPPEPEGRRIDPKDPYNNPRTSRAVHRNPGRRNPARLVYVIKASDVGKNVLVLEGRKTFVTDFLGRVQKIDIGKRIYNVDGIYQVENQEQLEKRLGKKNPARGGVVQIYDQVLRIEAKKGKKSLYPGEKFYHDFSRKSQAKIFGMPDGSLLIKGKKRLWDKIKQK